MAASQQARNMSNLARSQKTIDAHRLAIEAHRRANIAWCTAHRLAIDYEAPSETQRVSYRRYVSHYNALRRHWTHCWHLGTRRGLSFPHGAPCGPTSAYLDEETLEELHRNR